MTASEYISEFEILFEDLATAGSKGLDNYEKSICFTYAQEQIVKQLAIQGNLMPITGLIDTHQVLTNAFTQSEYKTGKNVAKIDNPLMEISYFATDNDIDIPGNIVPQNIIDTMLSVPYQYPPKNLVYVVVGKDTNTVFFPLNFTPVSFNTKYVKYPSPVILDTLTNGDSINGETAITLPVLEESYDRMLINAAVQYAIQVYIGQQEKEVSNGSTGNK